MTEKHYVFSARTTEKGLKILNDLKDKLGIGWDQLIVDAVCAHYKLDKSVIAVPKDTRREEERAAKKAKLEAEKKAKAEQRESDRKERTAKKEAEKKARADQRANELKERQGKREAEKKAKADARTKEQAAKAKAKQGAEKKAKAGTAKKS